MGNSKNQTLRWITLSIRVNGLLFCVLKIIKIITDCHGNWADFVCARHQKHTLQCSMACERECLRCRCVKNLQIVEPFHRWKPTRVVFSRTLQSVTSVLNEILQHDMAYIKNHLMNQCLAVAEKIVNVIGDCIKRNENHIFFAIECRTEASATSNSLLLCSFYSVMNDRRDTIHPHTHTHSACLLMFAQKRRDEED